MTEETKMPEHNFQYYVKDAVPSEHAGWVRFDLESRHAELGLNEVPRIQLWIKPGLAQAMYEELPECIAAAKQSEKLKDVPVHER